MKNINRTMMVGALILSLSACGTSSSDRMISGAGIGTGALIGGAVGAAAGGLTNSNQVNLGKPAWR